MPNGIPTGNNNGDSYGNITYKVNSSFFKPHYGDSNLLSLLNKGKFS